MFVLSVGGLVKSSNICLWKKLPWMLEDLKKKSNTQLLSIEIEWNEIYFDFLDYINVHSFNENSLNEMFIAWVQILNYTYIHVKAGTRFYEYKS